MSSGEQRIGGVDREVVAHRAVARQDLVYHLLPVHRVFQRHPQVVVVERRRVAMHDEHVVPAARLRCGSPRSAGACTMATMLRLDPVDHLHLARLQRRDRAVGSLITRSRPGRRSRGRRSNSRRDFSPPWRYARLVHRHLVGAGADAGRRVVHAAVRLDHQVIVGQQIGAGRRSARWVVRISSLPLRPGVLDTLHDPQRARLAFRVGNGARSWRSRPRRVRGLPSWKVTPSRILKVQVVASAEAPHSVARRGSSRAPVRPPRAVSPQQRPKV